MTDHTTADNFDGLDQDYQSRLTLAAGGFALRDGFGFAVVPV